MSDAFDQETGKISIEYMPCGTFRANAVFFAIGVLTYNLYLGFRGAAL